MSPHHLFKSKRWDSHKGSVRKDLNEKTEGHSTPWDSVRDASNRGTRLKHFKRLPYQSKAFANAQFLLWDILLDRGLSITVSTQSHRRREDMDESIRGSRKSAQLFISMCYHRYNEADYSRCRQVREYFLEYDVKKHLKYRRFQMCNIRPLKSDSRQKITKIYCLINLCYSELPAFGSSHWGCSLSWIHFGEVTTDAEISFDTCSDCNPFILLSGNWLHPIRCCTDIKFLTRSEAGVFTSRKKNHVLVFPMVFSTVPRGDIVQFTVNRVSK